MERYVTSTQLKQNLREVKRWADEDIVHVTENGKPAFVLVNMEVYERKRKEIRRRAEWQVDVEYEMRDGMRDRSQGRMVDISEVLDLRSRSQGTPVRITETAVRSVERFYDDEGRLLFAQMLDELSRRPDHGITIEYDSSIDLSHPRTDSTHKFCIPPCDVLYDYDERTGAMCILGLVQSLDC